MNKLAALAAAVMLSNGCSRPHQQQTAALERTIAQPRPGSSAAVRPLTVDPRSNEAAEDLVRGFAALVNSGRFEDAYMLLGAGARPQKSFESDLRRVDRLHVTVHSAADQEGAAGSVYVSVPLTVSGTENGQHVSRSARATLRRVNDVPGSTEAQRRWHIERIDWEH